MQISISVLRGQGAGAAGALRPSVLWRAVFSVCGPVMCSAAVLHGDAHFSLSVLVRMPRCLLSSLDFKLCRRNDCVLSTSISGSAPRAVLPVCSGRMCMRTGGWEFSIIPLSCHCCWKWWFSRHSNHILNVPCDVWLVTHKQIPPARNPFS